MMQEPAQYKLSGADRIAGLVTGMSDGLVIPFALVAGLSNVLQSSTPILQSGLVVTVVGAVAMALGGYYTGREQPHEDDLTGLDFDKETEAIIKQEQEKDEQAWARQQEAYEVNVGMPGKAAARQHALYIGLGYCFGGLIPVLAFLFNTAPVLSLRISVMMTLAALLVFGFLKAKFTGRNPVVGAITATMVGALTAATAFFLAGLFA